MAEGGAQGDYPTISGAEKSIYSTTKRGKQLLIDSLNYEYVFNNESKGRKYWICKNDRSKLHAKCPGRATTEGDFTVSTRPHNHLSDPTAVKVSCVEKKIIALAKEQPTLTTSHLLKEWAKATISPAERSKAMLRWSMRRKIQRAKNGTNPNPALPQNYDDLDDIPDQFTKTTDGERFLLFNDEFEEGRIIIFSSAHGLNMLQQAETWSCDGTFSVVPAPFLQFYIVMAELDNKSYPCFFALLPNKRSTTYSKMLEVLKDNVEMKGPLHLKQV
jgi:FLYWCH zinc finger domain